MNLKTAFLLILILANFTVFSQETWSIKYDEDGSEMLTDTNDYAYRREFVRTSNSSANFIGYTNKNEKLESGTTKNDVFDGLYKYFYSNGNINFEGEYKNGKPIGVWYEFYSNGNKKTHYKIIGESENDYLKSIISAWDSLGSPLVIEGKGRITEMSNGLQIEQNFVNGLLVGDMKFYDSSKKLVYTDTYKEGKFIKGYNHILKTEYDNIYSYPTYKGGQKNFEKYINNFLKDASNEKDLIGRKKNMLPNFKEFEIGLTISKNGELLSANLLNAKYNIVSALLLDAIKQTTNNWNPAILRGEKIEQFFICTYSNKGDILSHKNAISTFNLLGSYSQSQMLKTLNSF